MKTICLVVSTFMMTGCASLPQLLLLAEQTAVTEAVEMTIHHKTSEKDTTMNVQVESKEVKKDEE